MALKKSHITWMRFVPGAVGTLLGVALCIVGTFTAFGSWAWAFGVLPVALMTLGALILTVLGALPESVALEPVSHDVVPPMAATLIHQFMALGFRPFGSPMRAGMKPPALLIPLVHEGHRCFATVFETGTIPPKVAFDIVSLFGREGGLASNAEPLGVALPLPDTSLRQVFPQADPATVFRFHLAGLAHVASQGVEPCTLVQDEFPLLLAEGIRRQRAYFLEAPARRMVVMLSRIVTGKSPHLGPIESQLIARRGIQRLLALRAR